MMPQTKRDDAPATVEVKPRSVGGVGAGAARRLVVTPADVAETLTLMPPAADDPTRHHPLPDRLIVTIDGPAGTGKSSTARSLARCLGVEFLDTGAMYRAAAWAALRAGVPLDNEAALLRVAGRTRFDFTDGATRVDGQDVAGAIRTPEVAGAASAIAVRPRLRKILVDRQRRMGRGGGVVMEGRDVGTVVFPRAPVKFFLDATPEERARRRWKELRAKGAAPRLGEILRSIRERDERDRTRAASPLRAAADAVVIDTTGYTLAEVGGLMLAEVRRRSRR